MKNILTILYCLLLSCAAFSQGVSVGLGNYLYEHSVTANVKSYGALGDGSTDDATAIQNAINAASGGGGAAIVLVPAGTFILGTGLTLPAGCRLQGIGPASILKRKDGTSYGFMVSVNNNGSTTPFSGVGVANITFDDNNVAVPLQQVRVLGTATSGTYVLNYNGAATGTLNWNDSLATIQAALRGLGSDLTTCTVTGTTLDTPGGTYTIAFSSTPNQIITLTANTFTRIVGVSWYQQAHALGIFSSTDVSVLNCRFKRLAGDGVYISPGTVSSNYLPTDVRVADCHFDGDSANRQALTVVGGNNIVVTGCTFDNVSSIMQPGAIDLESNFNWQNVESISITACSFNNCVTSLNVINTGNSIIRSVTMTGCVTRNPRSFTVNLNNLKYGTFTGNATYNPPTAFTGYYVSFSRAISITGDNISGGAAVGSSIGYYFFQSTYCRLIGCFAHNMNHGVRWDTLSQGLCQGNGFEACTVGIRGSGATDIQCLGNYMEGGTTGIQQVDSGCDFWTVKDNTFQSNVQACLMWTGNGTSNIVKADARYASQSFTTSLNGTQTIASTNVQPGLERVVIGGTATGWTMQLPNTVLNIGQPLTIINISSQTVTLSGNGANISGSATLSMAANATRRVNWNGTNWDLVASVG